MTAMRFRVTHLLLLTALVALVAAAAAYFTSLPLDAFDLLWLTVLFSPILFYLLSCLSAAALIMLGKGCKRTSTTPRKQ